MLTSQLANTRTGKSYHKPAFLLDVFTVFAIVRTHLRVTGSNELLSQCKMVGRRKGSFGFTNLKSNEEIR